MDDPEDLGLTKIRESLRWSRVVAGGETREFKSPEEIREAWDEGAIDGAGCWGNTLTHLTSRAHGGTNETGPGHIIVDAATVARWGRAKSQHAFLSADTQWYRLDERQELQATLSDACRCSVP